MNCFCCNREIGVARKAKIRRLTVLPKLREPITTKDHPAAVMHAEQNTYRWGTVCPGCYLKLDNEVGMAIIGGETFTIAGASRFDRARCITIEQFHRWQRREAKKLGLGGEMA